MSVQSDQSRLHAGIYVMYMVDESVAMMYDRPTSATGHESRGGCGSYVSVSDRSL